jgi:hypothetical protein
MTAAAQRSLLALTADLDVAERPKVDDLIRAAKAARNLRLRLIKEHVRVTEAVRQLQEGLDEEEEGGEGDVPHGEHADLDADDAEIAERRRAALLTKLMATGDPTRLKRHDFVAICELEAIRSVVVPALVVHGNSEVASKTIDVAGTGGFFIETLKLLAALTMPVPAGSDEVPRQIDCLKRVRSVIAADDVLSFVVSAVAPIASSRLHGPLPKADQATIEVSLALFNNLLKAPPREAELVVGGMCRSHTLELLLVILRQNSAKLEEALLHAIEESGSAEDRAALRTLIGDGKAGERAIDATSALAASMAGADTAAHRSSRFASSSVARYSETVAAINSRDSHIPFPTTPSRSSMPASSSALVSRSPAHHHDAAMSSAARSSVAPGSTAPDAPDPIAVALLSTPRKSPAKNRPTSTPKQLFAASPMQQRARASPGSPQHHDADRTANTLDDDRLVVPGPTLQIPSSIELLPAGSTYLNIETQMLPPGVADVSDPFADDDDDDDDAQLAIVPSAPPVASTAAFPSPAPHTPLFESAALPPSTELPASVRGESARRSESRPEHPTAALGGDDDDDDDDDDDAALLNAGNFRDSPRKADKHSSETGEEDDDEEDEEDGLAAYERHGEAVDRSSDDESEAESALYDDEGNLVVTEKDLRRDKVLAKLFADDQRRVRGESMVTLRRWNLIILEACSLVFRAAPSATLATLGFGIATTGSAATAAKNAIADRLSSHADEMSRWRTTIKRRQGATTSGALLVQRADPTAEGLGGRMYAVGEANRSLTSRSQLESVQEADAKKRRKFRRKLLQSNDESATSLLPLPTQVMLAQQYRQFAEYGFTNLSSMLWPDLHRRVTELLDSMQAFKETAQVIRENNEGPLLNALDRVELGDVLNYAALTTTMLRFGRVTLRLRQAALTDEARELLRSGTSLNADPNADAAERERIAMSLVDHAMLPVATEVLTVTRLESALHVLDALATSKDLRKMYDYLVALNFVAELFRVLVHSVDGDLAPAEAVRLAATSLASTIVFNPGHIRTVLTTVNLVEHASASVRQVEATIRALHATMLLLDRVSYDGRVYQQVHSRKKKQGHTDANEEETAEEVDAETLLANLMDADDTQTQIRDQQALLQPHHDSDVDAELNYREGTPENQRLAPSALNDPIAAHVGPADDEEERLHTAADGDAGDQTQQRASPKKKASKRKEAAEPRTEKSVQIRDFFEQLVTAKRMAVFFHALRMWRQLADDVIDGLVYFMENFRSPQLRAGSAFFNMFAILPFSDIVHNKAEAPPGLYAIAMEYLRDFWCLSTTYEMTMRCTHSLFNLEPNWIQTGWLDSRDPAVLDLVNIYTGAAADAADADAPQGYTMYDEEGNPIQREFRAADFVPEERPKRKRRARRQRAGADADDGAGLDDEAPLVDDTVLDLDDTDAIVAMAERYYAEETAGQARADKKKKSTGKPGAAAEAAAKRRNKKEHRREEHDAVDPGGAGATAPIYLDESGNVKPKDLMTKAERKAYKRHKKEKKAAKKAKKAERKELKRLAKMAALQAAVAAGLPEPTSTQDIMGFLPTQTQMTADDDASDDSSDGSSSDDGFDVTQAPVDTEPFLHHEAGTLIPVDATVEPADCDLASFVATPAADDTDAPRQPQLSSALFDTDT